MRFERTCPLLLEGDHLLLSSEFALAGNCIIDEAAGIRHRVEPRGFELMRMLQLGASPTSLLEHAQHRGLEDRQLYDLLGFLNMIGALKRSRGVRDWVRMGAHGLVFLGFVSRFAALGSRRPANVKNITSLACLACKPVIAAVVVIGAAYYFLGISGPLPLILYGGIPLVIFIASIVLHEAGHAAALRNAGVVCSVMRNGMRLGLVHRKLQRALERKTALAGPLAAAAPLLGLALLSLAASLPLMAGSCLVMAVFHLLSLLPWYGDGRSIWRSRV